MNDYISRQTAIDKINERQRKLIYCFGFENDMVKIMNIAKNIITAIPAADAVPVVHGYWFVDERPESDREVICSVCEEPVFRYHDHIDWRPKYCPHCGAKMDECCPH